MKDTPASRTPWHVFLDGATSRSHRRMGQRLAQRLGLRFVDCTGDTVSALDGLATVPPAVVTLADTALRDPVCRAQALQCGTIVQLEPAAAGLAPRAAGPAVPPACVRLGPTPSEADLDRLQAAAGAYRVSGMGCAYDVRVGPGWHSRLGACFAAAGWSGRAVVVGDTHTSPRFTPAVMQSLRAAGVTVHDATLTAGEAHKTVATVHDLWRAFLAGRLERGDTVVAVGGGVVGDLSGFAAATWLRGIRWVGLPTSLLAMVDSSLGGKTGADLPEGKNLVGAFHPPALVLADSDALAALPDDEFRCGLAEVVKHGVIGDPELFAHCARGFAAVRAGNAAELASRAMAVKIRTIEQDPYERGVRAALNLGHTVGHAVEQASGFTLRHGEAVAIGLVVEARLSERLGLAARGLAECLETVLRGLGLPTAIPTALDRTAILAALQHDKKRAGGIVRFALPVRIGEVRTDVAVEPSLLADL